MSIFVYSNQDFYYLVYRQVLKQQYKVRNDPNDLKYQDIIFLADMCNNDRFKVYLYFEKTYIENVQIKNICILLIDRYISLRIKGG